MFKYVFTHKLIINIEFILFVISAPIKVLEKGILPLETNSIAIQFFLDIENEDKLDACLVNYRANKCCLIDKQDTDCDSVKLFGEYNDILKPKDRKTYLFFYLTLHPLYLQGYCDFGLDYHCGHKNVKKREDIKVPFDTCLNKKNTQYLLRNFKSQKIARCKTADEDPLNDCSPGRCEFLYSGTRPFYNKTSNTCAEAAKCIANPMKKLPDIVYEPVSNTCKDLENPLALGDIYAINSGLGVVIKPNETDEDKRLMVFKPNCSTISQNVQFLRDMVFGKLTPVRGYTLDFKESCSYAIMSIISCVVGLSAMVCLFICFATIAAWLREKEKNNLASKARDLQSRIKSKDVRYDDDDPSSVNKDVTRKLLKEVLVSELPLEMRDGVVDICERIGREVRWKKRYRMISRGSEIIPTDDTSDTSTTS